MSPLNSARNGATAPRFGSSYPPTPKRREPVDGPLPEATAPAPNLVSAPAWQPTATWELCRVNLIDVHGGNNPVDAKVYGAFAVHEGFWVDSDGCCELSHLPTSRRVARMRNELDAYRLGEELWSAACLLFRKKTKEEVNAAISPWLREWVKACDAARAYLPQKEFRK